MHRLLPFPLLLAVACGSPSGPEVTSQTTAEAAPVATDTPEVVEADYGDQGLLAEGVPLASETSPVAEPLDETPVDAATPTASFSLRRGETLAHFARWADMPVEDVAEYSELPLHGDYPVGTEVRLPLDEEAAEYVSALRDDHQTERVEGYLASRGGTLEEVTYSVRTGDSAWAIAKREGGLPVWLIESYNPDVDLERLRPGDELVLPVPADVVVDAADEVTMP